MLWSTILLATVVNGQLNLPKGLNHLRFGCSQITVERLDPLVNPGLIGTPHMHQVVGGNAFNASIPSTDVSSLASCTTCGPSDDLSNYWVGILRVIIPSFMMFRGIETLFLFGTSHFHLIQP